LLAGSVCLAALIVLTALPSRREGHRTDTDAVVPLRQPTAAEAVALVGDRNTDSAIIGEEGANLLIATRHYVIPREHADGGQEESGLAGEAPYYVTSAATWEDYYSLYRVSRRDYEAALGRELQPSDFTSPSFVEEYSVSFDPTHVPRYVAVEIVFLSLWLFALAKFLLTVRRLTALLPGLVLLLFAPFLFTVLYSPAFFDADFFYQRVVVEEVALVCLLFGMILVLPAVVSAIFYASLRAAEGLAALRGRSATAYRRRTLLGFGALAVLYLAVQYVRFSLEFSACLADRSIVSERVAKGEWVDDLLDPSLGLPRGTNLMDDESVDSTVKRAVEAVLKPSGERATQSLVVQTRVNEPGGEHLFMWRGGSMYADFRDLSGGFGVPIHATEQAETRRTGDFSTGYGGWLVGRSHICGETLEVRGRTVLVMVEQPWSPGILLHFPLLRHLALP
jgi:hypothetical protein